MRYSKFNVQIGQERFLALETNADDPPKLRGYFAGTPMTYAQSAGPLNLSAKELDYVEQRGAI